jgi:glycosyltransferase involved in cell wall biosynthesis
MKILFAESHNLDRPDPLGSHHYIRLFQQDGHDCCWLGPAISPLHIFKPDQINRHRFKVWQEGVREVKGIKWLVPFTLAFYYNLPLLKGLFIGRNQYRFCLPSLSKTLLKKGLSPVDLLWCAGPVAYSLLDLIPHRISCYRIADRLDQFSRIPPSNVELQRELIRRVDFVIATSQSLYEWVLKVRRHDVYYLPNGVSDRFFQPQLPRPSDLPDTHLPVAVYLGTIDTRFDFETIENAVKNCRQFYFLLIGPITETTLIPKINKLQQEQNFRWLGPKKQEEAISYLQHSNVGLIPFYLNELTEAVNPIKYYEYLACGLPVVASPLRELAHMKGPLHFYSDQHSFLKALEEAEKERSKKQDLYKSFAAENSWQKRFEEINRIKEQINDTKELQEQGSSRIWISVVMIGRNEAKNLPLLFDSLPTDSDVEWLYVDSGSSDGSPDLAHSRGARVLALDDQSVYAPATGRFVGTLEAKGRWVLYLDGDMVLSSQFKVFIEKLREDETAIPLSTAGFVGHTANCYQDVEGNEISRREEVVFHRQEAGSADGWGKPVSYHGGAVFYLRTAVLKAGNWNPALSQLEEIDLLSRVKKCGKTVWAVDLPMVEHHTPFVNTKEKLLLNFLPSWKGKKLYGAGQVVNAGLREGNLGSFIRSYPYPFIIFAGLIATPAFYYVWPLLPLLVNLLIALWIAVKKRWYFYLVYLGNLFQIFYGLGRYHPFKPGYYDYEPETIHQ